MITFSSLRAAVVMCTIGTLLLALLGRVGYLQTYGREMTIRRAERQQHQNEVLSSRRGSIYDCNGMLMAGTVQSTSLFIDPKFMQEEFEANGRSLNDMDKAIVKLAKLLDRDLTTQVMLGLIRVSANLTIDAVSRPIAVQIAAHRLAQVIQCVVRQRSGFPLAPKRLA